MRLYRSAYLMDATFNSEHAGIRYRCLGHNRASSAVRCPPRWPSSPTPARRKNVKPAGTDTGFLWRLNAYWRFEQVGDGVLIECESASLSRSVPIFARWVVTGIVEGVAKDALEGTLKSLRKFLVS